MTLDFNNLLSGFISPSFTQQTKKDVQISNSTNYQSTSTYSPSYMVQIDSPYAGMTKKDVSTQSPAVNAPITPSLTSNQDAGKSSGGAAAVGGLDLTGIAVVGILVVAGFFLIKK